MIHVLVDILPIALLGGLLGLDVVCFPQAMISRPLVAATAGGAPNAMRRPTTMRGSTAGKITRRISCGAVHPKLRPACRNIGGTLRTAFVVATSTGKSVARKIRNIGAKCDTPNQMTASGIQARGEIGRSSCRSGFSARSSIEYQPAIMPSCTPMTTAAVSPAPTRVSESRLYGERMLFSDSERIARPTSAGDRKTSVPLHLPARPPPARSTATECTGASARLQARSPVRSRLTP